MSSVSELTAWLSSLKEWTGRHLDQLRRLRADQEASRMRKREQSLRKTHPCWAKWNPDMLALDRGMAAAADE